MNEERIGRRVREGPPSCGEDPGPGVVIQPMEANVTYRHESCGWVDPTGTLAPEPLQLYLYQVEYAKLDRSRRKLERIQKQAFDAMYPVPGETGEAHAVRMRHALGQIASS